MNQTKTKTTFTVAYRYLDGRDEARRLAPYRIPAIMNDWSIYRGPRR